jgi:transposase
LARLVETGADRAVHGAVRWRRIDLQRVIGERFGVVYHELTVGKLLKALGFSHISATRGRTRGRSRRLRELRGHAERPSGRHQEGQTH